MAQKKKKSNEGEKNKKDEQKKTEKNNKEDGGEKKDTKQSVTVVLKIDLHCEGCATKVIKCIRSFEGVESLLGGDGQANMLTVIGKVDPAKLREAVEQKTHKKVELVSPSQKKGTNKDKDSNKENGGGGGEDNNKKKNDTKEKPKEKAEEKKSKEPPVTTAVLKVNLHCEGCIEKIHKIVSKTKGYHEMNIDRQKETVTVKGSMDMKVLAESLKKNLKKEVEIVPPKKDGGDWEKKEKGDGGGGGGNKEKGGGDSGEKVENYLVHQLGYQHPYPYVYELGYGDNLYHAPQMFSDENPNACAIM